MFTNSSEKYDVLEAADGRSGLKLWRSQPIDAVILAYELPDLSGLRVLIRGVPRPRHPETAVLFLSENLIYGMAVLVRNNGAQAYLVKSDITDKQLEAATRKAIATVGCTRKRSLF